MPTDTTTKSSDSNAPSQRQERRGYMAVFGEPVPRELGKLAANLFLSHKLDEMLQEQIDKGEPVKDWAAFGQPFVRASMVPPSERESVFND